MTLLSGNSLIILIVLSFIDTVLTYEWAKACLKKKPSLKVKQVESNPFIVVCWNNFGLQMGTFISGIILLIIQLLISSIHRYAFYVIAIILIFASYNHAHNFYRMKKGQIKAFKN